MKYFPFLGISNFHYTNVFIIVAFILFSLLIEVKTRKEKKKSTPDPYPIGIV